MNELDLRILELLKMKAVKNQWFDIAQKIRDAERLIKKRIDDKWSEDILKQNKE